MVITFLFVLLFSASDACANRDCDSLLLKLGCNVMTLQVDGLLATTGQQTMSGLPFQVDMDSSGAYLLTMGGPFGITAAKMYASADTFVMVNYLQQEVWHGDPSAKELKAATHLPIEAVDFLYLIRGRVPGDPCRFQRLSTPSGGILFKHRDTVGVEYVLVDSVRNILRQYQRKDTLGSLLVDVAFQDVHIVDGIPLPHTILITTQGKKQEVRVTIRDVVVNGRLPKPLAIVAPPTFGRRHFR